MAKSTDTVTKPLGLPKLPPPAGKSGATPAYPILTEDVGYPPSPLANTGGSGSGAGAANGSKRAGSLGSTVDKALQEVLGWKIKSGDAAGFVGALTQSFQLKVVEGAVVSTWTPRSYVVQTDLSGGIAGAQASIYTMAKTLSDQLLPLLDGLYPLDPKSDAETVAAIKDLVTSQVTNLTNEFGYLGGPRVMRVHQYFQTLLGIRLKLNLDSGITVAPEPVNPPGGSPLLKNFSGTTLTAPSPVFHGPARSPKWPTPKNYWTDPDTVLGSLGDLRDQLGLSELEKPHYINTVADEQDVTNFRIIVDYANSLLSAWQNNVQFFAGRQSKFLGTQLVVVSRQLGVISEAVDEVRFVLDSVFLGPTQRETYPLDFSLLNAELEAADLSPLSPIYLEDLLHWIQDFVGAEAQDIIQNAGKLGVGEDFIAMIKQLYYQAYGLYVISQAATNEAIGTTRVQESIHKLAAQLLELHGMASSIGVPYIGPGK